MSRPSPLYRSQSPASLAPSDTTYHSFLDVDLYEPAAAGLGAKRYPHPTVQDTLQRSTCSSMEKQQPVEPLEIKRQDSGYESMAPRTPQSSWRPTSTMSPSSSSSSHRLHTRPLLQRSPKSASVSHVPRHSGTYHRRSYQSYQSYPAQSHAPSSFFYFPRFASAEPSPDETELATGACVPLDPRAYVSGSNFAPGLPRRPETNPHSLPPPQTTHYWTSDRTRRLEYAAIDAASRGVRGWVMRHIVPDCFIPKDRRRVLFDDDRGSVVRYRIELETEGGVETDDLKQSRRGRPSWFNRRRFSQ